MNEFELLDVSGKGRLSRGEIVSYLEEKYQWVNCDVLDQIFRLINWAEDHTVSKEQFCSQYYEREKLLYHQINDLQSLGLRLEVTNNIFQATQKHKPTLYAIMKVNRAVIQSIKNNNTRNSSIQEISEEWMDLEVQFEDHLHELHYKLLQPSYSAASQSFQILLPVQENYFFAKFTFKSINFSKVSLGQAYISIPIPAQSEIRRMQKMKIDIVRQNLKVGFCEVTILFEENMEKIQEQIKEQLKLVKESDDICAKKMKEYEYLQFLWGIRHKSPEKISKLDVKWMIFLRILLIAVIGPLTLIVHGLGRFEPVALIVVMILLKNMTFVILRSEKFLLVWLTISGIVLDLIWLAFSAQTENRINFTKFDSAILTTYGLIFGEVMLVLYLVVVETAFGNSQQTSDHALKAEEIE